MGRHEIRLQRKKMTSRRIESHKNYYALMKKYERSSFGKRMLKIVIFIIIFLGIIMLAYFGLQGLKADRNNLLRPDARAHRIEHKTPQTVCNQYFSSNTILWKSVKTPKRT